MHCHKIERQLEELVDICRMHHMCVCCTQFRLTSRCCFVVQWGQEPSFDGCLPRGEEHTAQVWSSHVTQTRTENCQLKKKGKQLFLVKKNNKKKRIPLLLHAHGKLGDAKPLLRWALEGMEAAVGPMHSDTLTSVSNQGLLLRDHGKLGDAKPLLRQGLLPRSIRQL